jgi:hypothetical protein
MKIHLVYYYENEANGYTFAYCSTNLTIHPRFIPWPYGNSFLAEYASQLLSGNIGKPSVVNNVNIKSTVKKRIPISLQEFPIQSGEINIIKIPDLSLVRMAFETLNIHHSKNHGMITVGWRT